MGSGSRSSPIAVDDSEDEVQVLLNQPFDSPPIVLCNDDSISAQPSQLDLQHHLPGRPSSIGDEHGELHEKRKRAESIDVDYAQDSMSSSSTSPFSRQSLETRISQTQPESKRAKKKRRRLEREQQAGNTHIHQQPAGPLPFVMSMDSFPELHEAYSWSPGGVMHYTRELPLAGEMARLTAHAHTPAVGLGNNYNSYRDWGMLENSIPTPSTSSWVSSMVSAAESTLNDSRLDHPSIPWISPNPLPPSIPKLGHTPLPSHDEVTKGNPLHNLPPKPPPQIIGMKPDPDPKSKHGVFAKSTRYVPNPARTLVMEQLPKTHRSVDFVNSWCKNSCGAHPVQLSIDGPSGKALIEFATAELARKAWSSPKLGTSYAGLKPHQLKGKPREDLIKVWWYRVDGVGAGAGVGEIEEGEIEGDVEDKELDVPPPKETKKERKARLAKARQQKKLEFELAQKAAYAAKGLEPGLKGLEHEGSRITPHSSGVSSQQYTGNGAWESFVVSDYGPPLHQDDTYNYEDNRESIASSSRARSGSPLVAQVIDPQDNIKDYEDMEVGEDSVEYQLPNKCPDSASISDNDYPSSFSKPSVLANQMSGGLMHSQFDTRKITAPLEFPNIVEDSILPRSTPLKQSLSPMSKSASPPVPSEPRAMKNPPTGPSFAKRKKELQERHANQRKLELGEMRPSSTPSSNYDGNCSESKTEAGIMNTIPSSSQAMSGNGVESADSQAMEDRLRQLVLRSQRARNKPPDQIGDTSSLLNGPNTATHSKNDESKNDPSASLVSSASPASTPRTPTEANTSVSVSTHEFSLDDLAVSFITQTIETLKPQPSPSSVLKIQTPPSRSTIQSNLKLELAAKQRRLEQHIAESKTLMAQLTQARTKEEKERILAILRERTRSMEESSRDTSQDNSPSLNPTTSSSSKQNNPTPQLSTRPAPMWPVNSHDRCVLVVSDDEDEPGDM